MPLLLMPRCAHLLWVRWVFVPPVVSRRRPQVVTALPVRHAVRFVVLCVLLKMAPVNHVLSFALEPNAARETRLLLSHRACPNGLSPKAWQSLLRTLLWFLRQPRRSASGAGATLLVRVRRLTTLPLCTHPLRVLASTRRCPRAPMELTAGCIQTVSWPSLNLPACIAG